MFAALHRRALRARARRDVAAGPPVDAVRVESITLPERLACWIDDELGSPVASAVQQHGGMSPGPAARIVLADGRRFFVKAVSDEPAPYLPPRFRHEAQVLALLPPVDYRPELVATFDDGEWVALLLEDVEGTRPNLSDPVVMSAARDVIRAQTRSLTPDPFRLPVDDVAATVRRWHAAVAAVDPVVRGKLPHWWRQEEPKLLHRLESLADRMPPESWCHFDVRDDNLLQRPDDRIAVIDWGMARSGPAWMDEMLLHLHDVTTPTFDEHIAALPSYGVASDDGREEAVTDYLLCLGISLAVVAYGAPPAGLPRLMAHRRAESHRLLVGAARRLSYR